MKRQTVAAVAVLTVLGFLLVAPFSATASAQTSSSVCGGPNQPCANTPFGQAPASAPAEGAPALARTGINAEYLLLASVAALAFGCLVLLVVEARESAHLLRHQRAGAGGSL